MARSFTSRPVSIQHYLIFIIIILLTSTASFIIYLLAEHKWLQQQDHQRSVNINSAQGKLPRDSVFLQKIKQVAAVNKEKGIQNVPAVGLTQILELHFQQSNKTGKNRAEENVTLQMQIREQNERYSLKPNDRQTLNYNVHLFYYPWYGNPEIDGKYLHWNHQYLPHWQKEEAQKWPLGVHMPPDDIGSNFYPALGLYSSSDPVIINKHMAQIQSSGAGVIVVSWYPPDQADENGQPFDHLVPLLLDVAHRHGVKIALHIEPYKNRSGQALNQHVKYIIDSYGKHPAFYKRDVGGKQLPLFYIYDSYQIDSNLWAQALKLGGKYCLRGTQYDGIFLGLFLGPEDELKLLASGFDGFYTYFAANGFTKGSSWTNWKNFAKFAAKNNLLFVPSVGPGYTDTRVRPWNTQTTRKRLQGRYFRQSFQAALDAEVNLISVTSFNEWHEGTQVEPAVPKTIEGFKYEDYSPENPNFYLKLLKEYVDKFSLLKL